jgi:PucR family transcriptional regulator, purine catabolism regulatory protein
LNSAPTLTVDEVLIRPPFQNAQVIAGKTGLYRRVRWVHVLEIANFESLIHGEELILSTGVGFKQDVLSPTAYLEKLIKLNASCLCIEIGEYFSHIPQEMIEIANQHHFPLIIFPSKVRFVDITQDLHSFIINRHHQMLQDLEKLSREFQRSTLTSQGIFNVLKLLQKSVEAQIVYLPSHGQALLVPAKNNEHQLDMLDFLFSTIREVSSKDSAQSSPPLCYKDKYVLLQPIEVMGQKWAYIAVLLDQEPNEYIGLILDSAAISIGQHLLRKHYIEERKHHTENLWVHDLVYKRIQSEEMLHSYTDHNYQKFNEANYQVCFIEFENLPNDKVETAEDILESTQFHLSLMVRSAFEQYSFHPLLHINNNQLIVIALDLEPKVTPNDRLKEVFKWIQKINLGYSRSEIGFRAGVGQMYVGLKNAHLSYQEAVQALSLSSFYKKSVIHYDEIGVLQLLVNLNDENKLRSFVYQQLGPLIEEDQAKASELLHTLKVFLENNCSKQVAAQKLFIVRQSLYYRLEKIKELLGENGMATENRLTLQVALLGLQWLSPGLFPPWETTEKLLKKKM